MTYQVEKVKYEKVCSSKILYPIHLVNVWAWKMDGLPL